jgi:hypothetical protein
VSDTRALLNRITSFRQRLEQTPPLIPDAAPLDDADTAKAVATATLAASPKLLSQSLRTLTGAKTEAGPLPTQLTVRARRLLEDARGLIAAQRKVTQEPFLAGLLADEAAEGDALAVYARETVALTDAALRMVQAFPASAEAQLRMCDGVEVMLRNVRDRLAVTKSATHVRRKDAERIDGLAQRLTEVCDGRPVNLAWFMELGEQLLDDVRQGCPIKFLSVDPMSCRGHAGGPTVAAPARFVAAHALTAAQVLARIVQHDYEWAGRPLVPLVATFLMNVGLVKVPAAVLAKAEPLTPDERRLIDAHPETGATLVRRAFPDAGPVAEAVEAHHERPDGTGYPHAKIGETIPTLSRLLAVCDAYAAMACDRPHRPAKDPRTALTDTLMAADQGRLDRDFSEYLLNLAFHPIGTVVELTDGRIGVVAANHTSRVNLRLTARPVVAVLADAAGSVLARPEFIDLAAAERGGVVRVLTTAERTRLLAKYYPELCW